MEPNSYQKKILNRLRDYLRLPDTLAPADAYRALWESRDVRINPLAGDGMPPYRDTIKGIPHICFKVPTGGGKTFLAACSVRYIKDAAVRNGEGAVVWLVPSDTILEQTLSNLRNASHPYRRQLQKDFPAGVEVYSKEQLISGQNFQNPVSVQEHLSVFVLSYDSFRTNKKDGRQVYPPHRAVSGAASRQRRRCYVSEAQRTACGGRHPRGADCHQNRRCERTEKRGFAVA